MVRKIENGDVLEFVQQDGRTLLLYVRLNGVEVKTADFGDNLNIRRDSKWLVKLIAIEGEIYPSRNDT